MDKKYCKYFEKNFCKCGRLIDNFCKHYKGSKENIESCAYKCEKHGGKVQDDK